ncbi:MAG TPA: acetamidase/formamidase family protein [Anaeromyxobacteraceae bacterium]|nr:acetamidase/formamidase family protein [Anaeromyxobacteraceae bacterium]
MAAPLLEAGRFRLAVFGSILVAAVGIAATARAEGVVRIPKTGDRCADDPRCHNRWHPAIPPVARASPGDRVVLATRDAFDHGLDRSSSSEDVVALNLNLVHPLTGPLFVEGAEPGDVLAVTLENIEPDRFGYTIVVPGFGFLRDVFTEPFLVRWDLTREHATSPDLPGVRIRFDGFMGTVGVAPGPDEVEAYFRRESALAAAGGFVLLPEPLDAQPPAVCGPEGTHRDRCLRTIPPRENGGNMDVKQMQRGTTLLLPCFVRGCLLSIGDVHYAQGDGEVSGTAIEMDATVTVRIDVRKGLGDTVRQPHFEGGNQLKRLAPERFYATVGFPLKDAGEVPATHAYLDGERIGPLTNLSEDVTLAARNALLQMVDWLVETRGLTPEQAYVLSSVAVDLRIANLVDTPNVAVSAILDLDVFPRRDGDGARQP